MIHGTAPPSAGPPTLERQDAIGLIRLNRPRHHNRLEPDDIVVLSGLLDRVRLDRHLRVLVLGAGGSVFSAGYHLGVLRDTLNPDTTGRTPFAQLVDQIEDHPLPTIAALNGSVYGGAADLVLACDFRIGVQGMSLRIPAARLGIHYYAGGLRRFVERLGPDSARRLFLEAASVDGETLLRMGYLQELVDPEVLETRVRELALCLASNAPQATRAMKQALNAIARGHWQPATIDAAHLASLTGAEASEGIAAWHERRAPRFDDP